MKKPTYLITHYQRMEPSTHGWFELPFLTTSLEDPGIIYQGFVLERIPLAKRDLEILEEQGSHKKFTNPIETDTENVLWMSPEGIVWLANKEDPHSGEKIKVFDQNKDTLKELPD